MKKNYLSQLFGGSLILLITFNIFNILNFLFQSIMARMLTLSDYGILAALFSIIYMFAVFTESIQTIVAKYSAQEDKEGKLKNLFKISLKKSVSFALLFFVIYLIASILLSYFLKINYPLLALNGLMIITSCIIPVTRGIIQGKKKFSSLGTIMVAEGIAKLIFAVLFVWLGWRVYGAIAGTILGVVISILICFIPLRSILKSEEKDIKIKEAYSYSAPVFLSMLAILIFYSLDIFIAKIVFPSEIAGAYAIASILSKVIFFGTQPISKAMFPITAEKKSAQNKEKLLTLAVFILIACIILSLIVFFFFSDYIILLFSGKTIPGLGTILLCLCISMGFVSLANLSILYKLSLGKLRNAYYLFVFVALEVILLIIFSQNLLVFSLALLTSSAIFLWSTLVILK
jgi:O-antigen/teichoic acid export membrane protein